jgi:hypothetical protein
MPIVVHERHTDRLAGLRHVPRMTALGVYVTPKGCSTGSSVEQPSTGPIMEHGQPRPIVAVK